MNDVTLLLFGVVLALWLGAALWAVSSGLSMRAKASFAARKAGRLEQLLDSAPCLSALVRADGKIEASERFADWLGLSSLPRHLSELTGGETGLSGEDADALGRAVTAAQKAGKRFSLPLRAVGSERMLIVSGAPAPESLAARGAVILWLFDATESQAEIVALREDRSRLLTALESLAGVIEAAPMPMWHRGPDLRLTLVNSAYVQAVDGASAQDVVAAGQELVENIDGTTPIAAAAQAAQDGRILSRAVPATIHGDRRMMRVVDVPLGDAGVAGYAIDIQDLEQARGEYNRLLNAQRDLLDRLSAGVAQFGPDHALAFSNEPFHRMFAMDAAFLQDQPGLAQLLSRMRERRRLPEVRDFPAWSRDHLAWFTAQEPVEEIWRLADGTHLRVFAQPLPDGGLLLIFEDRTEQVQLAGARDTLLRVRAATFDNLFEAVGVFAADGKLQLWNNRFRKLWQADEALLSTHPHVDALMQTVAAQLARPEQISLVRELVRAATLDRKQRGGRVAFRDGRHFEFAAIPLPDGNALFTMLDITDSRRIEDALRERNRALEDADKVKTAFVSNMSYELRTPLTSIGGFGEMLKSGYAGKLSPSAGEYVDAILQSVERLSSLIDSVLDLTEGAGGALQVDLAPLALPALVEQIAADRQREAKEKDIDLAVHLDPGLGTVAGDAKRLGQAISHILGNAIRYTQGGGRVLVHGDGDAERARIVISDNGPGIDKKAQARAFDRFARAQLALRGEPVGFGLPLAQQLVEAHGGALELISEEGEGTVVTITLPRP